jgi:hypothetical protein
VAPPAPIAAPVAALPKSVVKPQAKPVERGPRATATAPPKSETNPSKCSDILQKASLEALTDDEAAFLRKECR